MLWVYHWQVKLPPWRLRLESSYFFWSASMYDPTQGFKCCANNEVADKEQKCCGNSIISKSRSCCRPRNYLQSSVGFSYNPRSQGKTDRHILSPYYCSSTSMVSYFIKYAVAAKKRGSFWQHFIMGIPNKDVAMAKYTLSTKVFARKMNLVGKNFFQLIQKALEIPAITYLNSAAEFLQTIK